jgi:hypothetical protein
MSDKQFSEWLQVSGYEETFSKYRSEQLKSGPPKFGDAVVDAWEKESWEDIAKGGSGLPKELKELQALLDKAKSGGSGG